MILPATVVPGVVVLMLWSMLPLFAVRNNATAIVATNAMAIIAEIVNCIFVQCVGLAFLSSDCSPEVLSCCRTWVNGDSSIKFCKAIVSLPPPDTLSERNCFN